MTLSKPERLHNRNSDQASDVIARQISLLISFTHKALSPRVYIIDITSGETSTIKIRFLS